MENIHTNSHYDADDDSDLEEEYEDAVLGDLTSDVVEPDNMEQDQPHEHFDTDLPSQHTDFSENNSELPGVSRSNECRVDAEWGVASTAERPSAETKLYGKNSNWLPTALWPLLLAFRSQRYLGAELEVVRGRTVLEDGAIVTLDMLQPPELVLIPGQTLPLTVFDPPTINMLQGCLQNNRTFGVLASWSEGVNKTIKNIGTTAEIYEYLPDQGTAGFRVKAKARQRFRKLNSKSNTNWKAQVQILPEIKLPDPLQAVQLQSLNRHRTNATLRLRCRRADAAVTRWPAFVYQQYDVNNLVKEIKKELLIFTQGQTDKDKEKAPVKLIIPDDPTELSFWVAQNMPMREKHRLLLLKLNSPIQRLRWELKALQQTLQLLFCHYCCTMIGCSHDMFSMSMEGPQSTYVNPGGYLHETITLYKVRNVFSIGPPSSEFSWFPGYEWSCCKCKQCNEHMGWKFTATNSQLKPVKFWGICRRSITVRMGSHQPTDDEIQLLIF